MNAAREECTTPKNDYFVEVSPVSAGKQEAFRRYPLPVDPSEQDKATKIRICSVARPHMRAFHLAWLSFFLAFLGWFSIPPLLPTISRELNLSKTDIANSNILAVTSTILGRVSVGPLCDRFGPRRVQSTLLILGAIPVGLSSTVTTAAGLLTVRFFIGFIGCAFVCAQSWVSDMFVNNVVGTANAIVGGWGNLGGGATFVIMPLVFDMFNSSDSISADSAWRLSMGFPAMCLLVVGFVLQFAADDTPRGKKHAERPKTTAHESPFLLVKTALSNPNTIILAIQYACTFGVELQLNSVLGLFFYEEFTKDNCDPTVDPEECRLLTQQTAGLMASLFGLMNIFARALGGYLSDKCNQRYEMKGRIAVLMAFLVSTSVSLLVFSRTNSLTAAGLVLALVSLFVQGGEGATFAIVPYVWPEYTGSVSGIVGAGGNVGAVCWGFLFKAATTSHNGLMYTGFVVGGCALLVPFLHINGYTSFNRFIDQTELITSRRSRRTINL